MVYLSIVMEREKCNHTSLGKKFTVKALWPCHSATGTKAEAVMDVLRAAKDSVLFFISGRSVSCLSNLLWNQGQANYLSTP